MFKFVCLILLSVHDRCSADQLIAGGLQVGVSGVEVWQGSLHNTVCEENYMTADPSVPALSSITLPLVVLACSVEVGVVWHCLWHEVASHLLQATR